MQIRTEAEALRPPPERLLERVVRGDENAFTELVVAYDRDMVGLCFVVCGDVELARDATQNAWHKLWTSPPTLRDETRLRSWLLSVAANEARQMLRRKRVGRVRELEARAERSGESSIDDRLDLEQLLRGLEPSERELLGLRYVVQMSSMEIGQQLGLSAEGVRSRLHRLLERLRKDLRDG